MRRTSAGSPLGQVAARAAQLLRPRGRAPRRQVPGIPVWPPPIERLSADLTRLGADLDRIEHSDLPAKAARLRASGLAYDLVLVDACRALELPLPGEPPLRPGERLVAELELARAGLRW